VRCRTEGVVSNSYAADKFGASPLMLRRLSLTNP
jgi:hypothetical protein